MSLAPEVTHNSVAAVRSKRFRHKAPFSGAHCTNNTSFSLIRNKDINR